MLSLYTSQAISADKKMPSNVWLIVVHFQLSEEGTFHCLKQWHFAKTISGAGISQGVQNIVVSLLFY